MQLTWPLARLVVVGKTHEKGFSSLLSWFDASLADERMEEGVLLGMRGARPFGSVMPKTLKPMTGEAALLPPSSH